MFVQNYTVAAIVSFRFAITGDRISDAFVSIDACFKYNWTPISSSGLTEKFFKWYLGYPLGTILNCKQLLLACWSQDWHQYNMSLWKSDISNRTSKLAILFRWSQCWVIGVLCFQLSMNFWCRDLGVGSIKEPATYK